MLLIEEIWKDIKNFEGYYQVSNLGNVRSLDRIVNSSNGNTQKIKGKLMIILYNKRVNIYEIHLRKNNKRKCFKIHRLVAEAFVYNDDPINKTSVNHIDGDRSNNCADNLEWVTYSENLEHAYDNLHRPVNRPKCTKRRCVSINKNTGHRTIYKSIESASRGTNISCTQIRRISTKECININYDFEIEGLN